MKAVLLRRSQLFSALTSIGRICSIVCCCGIYQMLLWLRLSWTESFSFSSILPNISALLSLTIIYAVVVVVIRRFQPNNLSLGAFLASFVGGLCVCLTGLTHDLSFTLTKLYNGPSQPTFLLFRTFVAVSLFWCGISKIIMWLSDLHLFLLFFLLMAVGGLCISCAVCKWIKSHLSEDVGNCILSTQVKVFLFSVLICSVIIKVPNQGYET